MTLNTIETVIGHWVTVIKAHERLLLAAIAAFVLWHFGNQAFDAYGKHLTAQQTAINSQIADVAKSNADLAQSVALLKATVDAQAKIDDAKIAAAKKELQVKQQQAATLPLPDLSREWQSLLSLPDGSITPQPNGTVAVTTDAAHTTVNELLKVPDLTTELAATNDKLKGCTELTARQDTQISGLNDEVALEKKGRAEDAKIAAHDKHKAWMSGFKWGAVAGFVGGIFTLHKL